jgi:hypothetical protein
MALQLGVPEIRDDLSNDEKVELILDLTRRLELLEELMQAAKHRREQPANDACMDRFPDSHLDDVHTCGSPHVD